MSESSAIEWTDGMTFNPISGCERVSEGCRFCYAETMSHRNPKTLGVWGPNGTRVGRSEAYWKEPFKWAKAWRGRERRGRVFCASMADWLEDRPEWKEPRRRLLETISKTSDALEWLLLTKRPENGARLLARKEVLYVDGIHLLKANRARLGVSVESQDYAKRITDLLAWWDGPNFVSAEPLLGPVDFADVEIRIPTRDPRRRVSVQLTGFIDWVIVGGESGPGHRPMDLAAARSIFDQCRAAAVPVFIKQDSGPRPGMRGGLDYDMWSAKEFPR